MTPPLSNHHYHRISSRYPSSPSYNEFVEMFTEFAFHEVHEQKDRLRNNFNWEYVMPRLARSSVRSHCRKAGIRPPQNYATIVTQKLSQLYRQYGVATGWQTAQGA